MIAKHKFIILVVTILVSGASTMRSQGTVFGFLAGPTLSTSKLNGFVKEPFVRYHAIAFIESSSEISPNNLYARLGYHIKGSAVNYGYYYDNVGNEYPGGSQSMEFHNISVSLGVKQRQEIGTKHISYGFGIRGDFNLDSKFGVLFSGLDGTQNPFTYGVDVDAGIEFPLSELISVLIEAGVSPDFSDQIFIPTQHTDYYYEDGITPIIIPETKLVNVVFEVRAGFRFWHKVIYTD